MKWWNNLLEDLNRAIDNDNQSWALDVVLAAYRAFELGKISRAECNRIVCQYDMWEKSWAE